MEKEVRDNLLDVQGRYGGNARLMGRYAKRSNNRYEYGGTQELYGTLFN